MATALGQYELVAKLATGGMGEIFIARFVGPAGFERLVVIKQMLPHLASHDHAIAMFIEEANLAARIRHPNVCQVHELGVSDGKYFLVMEYLEGVTLSRCTARLQPTTSASDMRFVVGVASQACEGLHHIHQAKNLDGSVAGIVHRDVSPQNLFVTVDGVVKILEFGIAKRHDSPLKTRTGALIGKLCYMAPEQILGAGVDARADVFALGAVLFEQVTGTPVFRRETDFQTLKAITEEQLPALPIEGAFGATVTRALERDRSRRFASARELGDALAHAAADLGGPMSASELAAWVDREFGDELRRRHMRLQQLIADPVRDDAEPETSSPSIVPLRSDQRSALASWRTETTAAPAVGRTPSRWLWPVVAATLGAALVAALWGWRASSSPAPATQPPPPVAVAVAADAGITADAGAVDKREPPSATPSRRAPPPRPAPRGYFTAVSTPYAEIFVDGHRIDITPLVKHPLAPGTHKIRAVTRDGRTQQFSVRIAAGEELRRRLEW